MKYLNKLFAFDDRDSQHKSSATLTSSLYSVTFVANPKTRARSNNATTNQTDSSEDETFSHKRVTIISHGEQLNPSRSFESNLLKSVASEEEEKEEKTEQHQQATTRRDTESSLGGYLLTATLGKTIASTSTITPKSEQLVGEDDDWILVDSISKTTIEGKTTSVAPQTTIAKSHNKKRHGIIRISKLQQMAMDKTDVELIKASWLPVRKDPVSLGVLLFKGLFTKFPQYLKFFPQFDDLDIERMHEHKRLLRHAVKVIETVTFVVDSIGDETKTNQLNEALINLVRGHLSRKIGLSEFRNLGVVLIDFICDVNNRRGGFHNVAYKPAAQLIKSSTSDSSNHSSNDSETMTSALDKIRTSSSPSSSSEEESYLASKSIGENNNLNIQNNYNTFGQSNIAKKEDDLGAVESGCTRGIKIDTNLLVTAWTKLYSSILDLVGREEDQLTKS